MSEVTLESELERCRDWLEAALEYSGGTHTFEDIVEGIHRAAFQFWPAPNGAAITEIIEFPRKRVLHVFLAGGELDQIVDMDKSAGEFAKANGCTAMTIAGRKGWEKVLKKNGWDYYFTTLSREV
jgi:hypothetical protein